MITETLRTIQTAQFEVVIEVVDYHEPSHWLFDLFEPVDKHEGGVTVRTPVNAGDGRYYQWYRPTQYTLAELAQSYAKQGIDNPSREAYVSAQKELGWYCTATDCGFLVTVKKNGITIAETHAGFGFDYSYAYCPQTLEEYAWANFRDVIRECLHEAVKEARDAIERVAT